MQAEEKKRDARASLLCVRFLQHLYRVPHGQHEQQHRRAPDHIVREAANSDTAMAAMLSTSTAQVSA